MIFLKSPLREKSANFLYDTPIDRNLCEIRCRLKRSK